MNKPTSEAVMSELLNLADNKDLDSSKLREVVVGLNEEGWFCRIDRWSGWHVAAHGETIQDAYVAVQHMIAGTDPPPF